MALITAIKAGNLNDPTIWDLARTPAPGDEIDTAGFAVVYNPDLPAVASVLDTDTVNNITGAYHAPTVDEVQADIAFGAA